MQRVDEVVIDINDIEIGVNDAIEIGANDTNSGGWIQLFIDSYTAIINVFYRW